MAPVGLLGVAPGERILDLCAAPGGKSTQIGALLDGKGLLISNEIHPARAKILSENIERMGIRNVCVTNETPARLAEHFVEYFDRILVDAPCSGEGMFRKNDAACGEWSPENVELCGKRQDEILDCAARMLRPGGRMVYSTCTFAPTENEGSVSRFLAVHPDFHIVKVDKRVFGTPNCDGVRGFLPKVLAAEGVEDTVRLWPHHIKGEGHYVAVLQKENRVLENHGVTSEICETISEKHMKTSVYYEETAADCGKKAAKKEKAAKKDKRTVSGKAQGNYGEEPDFVQFCKESLRLFPENLHLSLGDTGRGEFLWFGDNLYLAPWNMPSLKGLKVLRPGLHLGTMKKNRFEPSHALALALSPAEAVHVWNLSSTDNTIYAYLKGQTFPAEGEKGWYLICVDGFSIGWGKLAGGIMKNHYPKGLRK